MAVAPSRHLLVARLPSDLRTAQRLYHEATKGIKCKDFLHAGHESCLLGYLDMVKGSAWGTARFFFMIFLIRIAFHYKKAFALDKKFYMELARSYVRSICGGAVIGSTYVLAACQLSRLINGFNFWISSFLPGVVAGFGIFIVDPSRRKADMNAVYNAALQYLYHRVQLGGYLPRSAEGETIVFMAVNALLLYLLATTRSKQSVFWFYIPDKVKSVETTNMEHNCCVPHTGSCWTSAIKTTQRYIAFTTALQACRILLSQGQKVFSQPSIFFSHFLTKKTFALVASITGNVFLYKVLRCLLAKRFGKDKPLHSAQAGLIAGATFWLQPNITIMCSAIAATVTLLYERMPNQLRLSDNWKIGEFLFALSMGLLFHARCMDMRNCPDFITRLTDNATHYRSQKIEDALLKRMQSLGLI